MLTPLKHLFLIVSPPRHRLTMQGRISLIFLFLLCILGGEGTVPPTSAGFATDLYMSPYGSLQTMTSVNLLINSTVRLQTQILLHLIRSLVLSSILLRSPNLSSSSCYACLHPELGGHSTCPIPNSHAGRSATCSRSQWIHTGTPLHLELRC